MGQVHESVIGPLKGVLVEPSTGHMNVFKERINDRDHRERQRCLSDQAKADANMLTEQPAVTENHI